MDNGKAFGIYHHAASYDLSGIGEIKISEKQDVDLFPNIRTNFTLQKLFLERTTGRKIINKNFYDDMK